MHGILGAGFLEKVYENAMMVELAPAGLLVQQQLCLPVFTREKKLVSTMLICLLKIRLCAN
nr:GxxExxY protein [Sulfuriferula plumbiphila]